MEGKIVCLLLLVAGSLAVPRSSKVGECMQPECLISCTDAGHSGGNCIDGECICNGLEVAECMQPECHISCTDAGHSGGNCIDGKCVCI